MKDQLIFSTTLTDDSDNVGAYLRAGTDGDLISSGDGSSDDVANGFEGIDTRAFAFGYDSVAGAWDRLNATAGAMNVFIDGGDFEVDVVINAERAEDSAHTTGDIGNYVLNVREDSLTASTSADGDYQSFKSNNLGELYTTDVGAEALLTTIDADTGAIATSVASIDSDTTTIATNTGTTATNTGTTATNTGTIAGDTTSIDATLTALSKSEDSVHGSGDQGFMQLAVRNDANTPLAADGDYIPFTTDASGSQHVNVTNTISTSDAALANIAIVNTATSVGVTATDLVATDLAGRKYAFVYNNGNKKLFVGGATVTTTNGFPLSPGSYLELRAGAAINLGAISTAAAQNTRIMELS